MSESQPVATLYVENFKQPRHITLYGRSGSKYEFRYDPTVKRPVRHYFSAEQFKREELDIRRVAKQKWHICTFVGSIDPVTASHEALQTLIDARMKVPGDKRKQALERHVAVATAALADWSHELPATTGVMDAEPTGKRYPSVVAMIEGENMPQSVKDAFHRSANWTEAELMQVPLDDLATICKQVGVTTAIRNLRTRRQRVDAILARQAELANT